MADRTPASIERDWQRHAREVSLARHVESLEARVASLEKTIKVLWGKFIAPSIGS